MHYGDDLHVIQREGDDNNRWSHPERCFIKWHLKSCSCMTIKILSSASEEGTLVSTDLHSGLASIIYLYWSLAPTSRPPALVLFVIHKCCVLILISTLVCECMYYALKEQKKCYQHPSTSSQKTSIFYLKFFLRKGKPIHAWYGKFSVLKVTLDFYAKLNESIACKRSICRPKRIYLSNLICHVLHPLVQSGMSQSEIMINGNVTLAIKSTFWTVTVRFCI